ncbi:mechanosensitive ion channel domain-containing protein [Dongia deserti]|uniref:mechanosensitive ion channel domain-containing protein n=1 Tax=Dongia deserti TaxID=2268030 RepID=UPI0013C47629|nr:mechanosensitive ion channel domain-containing protein [Dongia deserti]
MKISRLLKGWLVAILATLALSIAVPHANAQTPSPAPAPEPTATPGDKQAAPASGTREDLQNMLDTLRDPAKREELEKQIETLLAVQQPEPAPEEQPRIGMRILDTLSSGSEQFSQTLEDLGRGFGASGQLLSWLEIQATDPMRRAMWIDVGWDLVLSLGAGFLVAYVIAVLVRAARHRLAQRAGDRLFRRIRFSAARLLLEMLPVIAFGLVAFGVAGWTAPIPTARVALLAFINATLISMAGAVAARFVFSPMEPGLRLFPLSDATAVYLYVWSRRLIVVIAWGYVLLQAALLLGLPPSGYAIGAKIVGLIVAALLIVLVLQNRETVAYWIRGGPAEGGRRIARGRAAEIWHVAAIAYLAGVYLIWAFNIAGGFLYLLRATVLTVLVIGLLVAGEYWVPRLLDRFSGLDAPLVARYPFVAARTSRYLPILRRVLVYAIRIVAILVILAAWQVGVTAILFSDTGRNILGRLFDIAVVLVISLAAWEVANGLITAHLNRRDTSGASLIRSARMRTLLPLIRNALMIVIAVMATLVVLSEIGVDIAPLLAGAGVAGLAIGFGAQSLVKDVITGAFILFEDTINIGDVVNINGTGGLVEGMTVRTIRLRDLSGNVHTIPFGSITTVTNMTREFSYYLLDVGVAYRERTDDVVAIMREVDAELREDPTLGPDIIAPIEILGVDRFEDSAVVVRGRIKTLPIRQWDVGREYNRRLKMKFDERGIEMPFPHRTIYFGEGKTGTAPPARIVREESGTPVTKRDR